MSIIKFLWMIRKISYMFIGGLLVTNIIVYCQVVELSINNLMYMNLLMAVIYVLLVVSEYLRIRSITKTLSDLGEQGQYEALMDSNLYQDELLKVYTQITTQYVHKNREEKYAMLLERKDFMDYIISFVHTAKTPVTASKLMLSHVDFTEEATVLVNKLEDELLKIENYLDQALYYTRLDDFEKDYQVEEYLLKDIFNQVIKKLSKIFVEKRIQLHLDLGEAKVYTDKKSFGFVIQQIMVNSLKYMDEKGTMTVSLQIEGKNKRIFIRDSGVGIKVEDLPRVFEKGFTGYNGRVYEHSTGIGLYLAKKICHQLGHEIRIDSEFGVFTQVEILIKN